MTDNYENGYYGNSNDTDNTTNNENVSATEDTSNTASSYEDISSKEETAESSYEWNAGSNSSGEYRYSYINGNNQTASHNPNNYDNAYSSRAENTESTYSSGYSSDNTSNNANYSSYGTHNSSNAYNSQQPYGNSYGSNSTYNSYSSQPYSSYSHGQHYGTSGNTQNTNNAKPKKQKVKKQKKPASRGFVAAILIISILASGAVGFGGGYLANKLGSTSNSHGININKVDSSSNATNTSVSSETASSVVKKAADSVVEIRTESVVTGQFNRQYVAQGAGSGVIASADGYIITNNHVIDGANSIKVTLRDGQTSYDAKLIGTDAENDIALIKVEAEGLTPATFGDSSNLAVGDYVVAIGNPLGELGGTVTDGIISSLAREVTIENQNMTLLQTNAQINPGNSGGGLFNANGELIGIVNAKESATEVEGIGFAIPVNNALKVINDLKAYGYVTGKVDLGMEFVDINSTETAFYYGVNKTGCYILSVTSESNADKAGFKSGDLINSVDGKEVTKSAEIDAILDKKEVGDKVKFNVIRNGKKIDLELTLAEYVPSNKISNDNQKNNNSSSSGTPEDSIWSQMFGW